LDAFSRYHDGCFVILFALTREEGSRNASHPVPLGYVNVAVRSPFCQQSAKEVLFSLVKKKRKETVKLSGFFFPPSLTTRERKGGNKFQESGVAS